MCEVEFWEVFLANVREFFKWLLLFPLVDCRIADLE